MALRAPEPADLDVVLAVIIARDVADLGVPDYTRADLEDDWRQAGAALATDARVAERHGEVRGYAMVRPSDALLVVHPKATGHGLGGAPAFLSCRRAGMKRRVRGQRGRGSSTTSGISRSARA